MPGSTLFEWVHRQAGHWIGTGDVHAGAVAQARAFARGSGANHGTFSGGGEGTGRAGTDSHIRVSAQAGPGEIANEFRRQRGTRDGIVCIGVAQEKAQAFNGKKVNGQLQFDRDKTVLRQPLLLLHRQ